MGKPFILEVDDFSGACCRKILTHKLYFFPQNPRPDRERGSVSNLGTALSLSNLLSLTHCSLTLSLSLSLSLPLPPSLGPSLCPSRYCTLSLSRAMWLTLAEWWHVLETATSLSHYLLRRYDWSPSFHQCHPSLSHYLLRRYYWSHSFHQCHPLERSLAF